MTTLIDRHGTLKELEWWLSFYQGIDKDNFTVTFSHNPVYIKPGVLDERIVSIEEIECIISGGGYFLVYTAINNQYLLEDLSDEDLVTIYDAIIK